MKKLASKSGPILKERWARLGNVLLQGDCAPVMTIEIFDVTKTDLGRIADELYSSGYAQEVEVQESCLQLIGYDLLIGDVESVLDVIAQLLAELNYHLLNDKKSNQ